MRHALAPVVAFLRGLFELHQYGQPFLSLHIFAFLPFFSPSVTLLYEVFLEACGGVDSSGGGSGSGVNVIVVVVGVGVMVLVVLSMLSYVTYG
jgi:hypothetical protein